MHNNGYPYNINNNGDRFFFPFFPFVLGGLAGGALVGATRPRPVYVNSPAPYPPYQSYPPYRPNGPGYYNYQSGGFY